LPLERISREGPGTDASQDDGAELWAQLRADPSAGLARVYDRHASLVYGLARRILRNPRDAEDLTQEVFVSLLTRDDFDAGRGSLAAFLAMITRSRAIDRLRAGERARLAFERLAVEHEDDAEPAAGESVAGMQSSSAVAAALAELPERQRRVLELAYFEGLSQSQIAERIPAPLGTVKSWMRSALLALRGRLSELHGP
jgi:RNA polymerase sigma-70 factor (ECF subfamily)